VNGTAQSYGVIPQLTAIVGECRLPWSNRATNAITLRQHRGLAQPGRGCHANPPCLPRA
jgi:hypothetical protein